MIILVQRRRGEIYQEYTLKCSYKRHLQKNAYFCESTKAHSLSQRPYISPDGVSYESYEAYCDSPDLDDYTVMLKLHAGLRKPQNDFERALLKEMQDIKASGGEIDFTENIW